MEHACRAATERSGAYPCPRHGRHDGSTGSGPAGAAREDRDTYGKRATREETIAMSERSGSDQTWVVEAWVSWAEEGRGALRKALGSRRAGAEPGIPEWGNPPVVMDRHGALNV